MKKAKKKKPFKGKKVLVTGHTGFKGAWLSLILLNQSASVYGYSLEPPTQPNLFDVLNLKKDLKHQTGDIRDFDKLNRYIKRIKPDIIFHLAAQPIVRASYDDPLYTYQTNVLGTANVLETMRQHQIRTGVIITTDKVYRNLETGIAFCEDDPLGGHDPYSNSKACADLIVDSYLKSYFQPEKYQKDHQTLVASARAGNVIGGGDWAADRLVPDAVRSLLLKKEPLIIRSPKAVRPWQHVFEPLDGYLLLAEHLDSGSHDKIGAYNFAPEDSSMKPVREVIELILGHLKFGQYVVEEDKTKHEASLLKLNNSKAKKVLGWQSVYDIERSVIETINWYREYHLGEGNIKKYSLLKINEYFN